MRWSSHGRVPFLALVSVLVAGWLATGCSGGGGASTSTRTAATSSPAASSTGVRSTEPIAYCVTREQQASSGVVVKSSAGGTIVAVVQGRGTTGIVFANMSDNDLCGWLGAASDYAAKGYRTAVFSYSDQQDADADIADIAADLRRRGASKIVLIGASKGGTAVLAAASRVQPTAVVELSAPDTYEGMDAQAAVKTLTVPSLFIVGADDLEFVNSTDDLYSASPAKVKQRKVVASPAHGIALLPDDAVAGTIGQFLATNAPASG